MKTATKKTRKKVARSKAKPARTRPLLSQEELAAEERDLRKKFPKIVVGSLRNRGDDPGKNPIYANKRTVEIKCAKRGCQNVRRVATSDLFQIKMCVGCTEEARAARKNSARRNKSPK